MLETLDLGRPVRAGGGRRGRDRDLVVDRRPPDLAWFVAQRVRQAYDELARPWRLAWQLALLPALLVGRPPPRWRRRRWDAGGAAGRPSRRRPPCGPRRGSPSGPCPRGSPWPPGPGAA